MVVLSCCLLGGWWCNRGHGTAFFFVVSFGGCWWKFVKPFVAWQASDLFCFWANTLPGHSSSNDSKGEMVFVGFIDFVWWVLQGTRRTNIRKHSARKNGIGFVLGGKDNDPVVKSELIEKTKPVSHQSFQCMWWPRVQRTREELKIQLL